MAVTDVRTSMLFIQLNTIYKKVSSIDPENEAYYKENLKKAQDEFRTYFYH